MRNITNPATLLLALAFAAASPTAVSPAAALADTPGFHLAKTSGGIADYTLDANGLEVLLLEDHSAPVVTVMVTYRVGSRNEVTGTTGATHLLEHLMFKGSAKFHPGIGKGFDTVMDGVGAVSNASTSLDSTSYFENLPSDQLGLALEVEADRMRGLLLRDEDRHSEMTVVRNEFERGENDAAEALDKEVGAAAYLAHPYHHPTIGWLSDIENVPIAKLREFYDTFYWPGNAVLTVIGDITAADALALVKKNFGGLARAPKPFPQVYTVEPAQTGPRRVVVKRPGEVGAVEIAYKAPAGSDRDHAPLDVLNSILGDGKTSRLYRALLDTNLAIDVDASKGYTRDNTLLSVGAMLAPGATHDKVEKVMLAEIARVVAAGVTADEVSRAVSKLVASTAYSRDGSFAIASEISESIAVGDWTLYAEGLERLKAVTVADVNRVAKRYLVEDASTTGWFVPTAQSASPHGAAVATHPHVAHRIADAARGAHSYRERSGERCEDGLQRGKRFEDGDGPGPVPPRSAATTGRWFGGTENLAGNIAPDGALVAPKVHRRTVAGIDVLTLATSIHDVVTIRGSLGGGDMANPGGNSAIADLVAGMLDLGTAAHDKFAIAAQLERVGATIEFTSGTHTVEFQIKCLRRDLDLVLGLLGEQLRRPRFDAAEFAKLKKQIAGEREHAMEDPGFRAVEAFDRAAFPAGHPNRPPANDKYLADVHAATLEQLRAFHAANYGPASAHMVAVGDIDDGGLDAALHKAFDGWKGGKAIPLSPKAPALAAASVETIAMPGKTSAAVVIGQPSGLRYSDGDYQALRIATAVLGSGFFSARLLSTVRSREGLTYDIGASLGDDTFVDGSWKISATFAPALLDKGVASTLRELKRFAAEGITAQELATFQVALAGAYKVALSTSDGLAATLLRAIERGYGPEWIDEYPRRLRSLTLAEANDAIRRTLDIDRMVTVTAGTVAAKGEKP